MDDLAALIPGFAPPSLLVCGEFTPRATEGASGGLEVAVRDIGLCAPEAMRFDVPDICLIAPLPGCAQDTLNTQDRSFGRFQGSRTLSLIFEELDRDVEESQRCSIFNLLANPALCHLIGPETHYLANEYAFEVADKLGGLMVRAVSYAFQDADKRRYTFTSVDPAREPNGNQQLFIPRRAIKSLHSLSKEERREEAELIRHMAHLPAKKDLLINSRIDFEHGHVLVSEKVSILASRLRRELIKNISDGSKPVKPVI